MNIYLFTSVCVAWLVEFSRCDIDYLRSSLFFFHHQEYRDASDLSDFRKVYRLELLLETNSANSFYIDYHIHLPSQETDNMRVSIAIIATITGQIVHAQFGMDMLPGSMVSGSMVTCQSGAFSLSDERVSSLTHDLRSCTYSNL